MGRFTRTSAMADIWVPLRAGTDILFLGGLIRYAIENDKHFREYVQHYTDAPMIIREEFRDTDELGGVFSGWNEKEKKYDPKSWLYEGSEEKDSGGQKPGHAPAGGGHGKDRGGEAAMTEYEMDETLQHPRCVFQILRRHFSRSARGGAAEALPESCGGVLQRVGIGQDRRHLLRRGMDATF